MTFWKGRTLCSIKGFSYLCKFLLMMFWILNAISEKYCNVNWTVSLLDTTVSAGPTGQSGVIALHCWGTFCSSSSILTSPQCHELGTSSRSCLGVSHSPPAAAEQKTPGNSPAPRHVNVLHDPHMDQCPCGPGDKQPSGFSKQIIRKWFPLSS